jgi:hypothetical protein
MEQDKLILNLIGALEECLEYFEHHSDVVDGDDGQPEPNREMYMASMINNVLGRN